MPRTLSIIVSLVAAVVAMGQNMVSPKTFFNINLAAKAGVAYHSLCQDSTGMIWLGTDVGLCNYDGYSMRNLADAGDNAKINSIVASDSLLYVGTDTGVQLYDISKGEYEVPRNVSFPSCVRSLAIDDGGLWVGSLDGLYYYDFMTGLLQDRSDGLPHRAVSTVCITCNGDLYAGTHNGLCRYDRVSGKNAVVEIAYDGRRRNLFVNALADDARRRCLWIGTEDALYRYGYDDCTISVDRRYVGRSIKSLAIGQNGDLIVGTDNGLLVCNERRMESYRHDSRMASSLSGNVVRSVMADRDGNLWVGTESGLSEWVNEGDFTCIPLYRLSGGNGGSNRFYAIFRDSRGYLWLGGTHGLIRRSPGGQMKWYKAGDRNCQLEHNRVRCIYEDSHYELWIATDAGISRYDYISERFVNYTLTDSSHVNSADSACGIVEDRSGMMWVGACLDGLSGISRSSLVASPDGCAEAEVVYNSSSGFPSDKVTGLDVSRDGSKWVSFCRSGAIARIEGSGSNADVKVLDISDSSLQYIVADEKRGGLWCGHHNGIAYMSEADTVSRRYEFQSVPDVDVYAMEMVRGNLWISTSHGVWVLEPGNGQMHHLRLPDRIYTSIYNDRASHKVLLGGYEEVVVVNPSILSRKEKKHEITITGINVNGRKYKGKAADSLDGIKLAHGQKSIVVEFSDFDYNAYSRKGFEFRIGRGNGEWTILSSGGNSIELAGMAPGSYVLEIRLLDGIGVSAVKTLKIDVAPAWYASWWAITVYVLLGVMFVLWVLSFLCRKMGLCICRIR